MTMTTAMPRITSSFVALAISHPPPGEGAEELTEPRSLRDAQQCLEEIRRRGGRRGRSRFSRGGPSGGLAAGAGPGRAPQTPVYLPRGGFGNAPPPRGPRGRPTTRRRPRAGRRLEPLALVDAARQHDVVDGAGAHLQLIEPLFPEHLFHLRAGKGHRALVGDAIRPYCVVVHGVDEHARQVGEGGAAAIELPPRLVVDQRDLATRDGIDEHAPELADAAGQPVVPAVAVDVLDAASRVYEHREAVVPAQIERRQPAGGGVRKAERLAVEHAVEVEEEQALRPRDGRWGGEARGHESVQQRREDVTRREVASVPFVAIHRVVAGSLGERLVHQQRTVEQLVQ